MVDAEDGVPGPSNITRVPTREDLVRVCTALNQAEARYLVLGGAAMIELGVPRTTQDLDLLVDADPINVSRVCAALTILEDAASREVMPTDVQNFTVVRINDEFTVDLMGSACGLD